MDQVHIIQFCYLCESTLASALAITIAIMFGTGTCATCTIEQLTMQHLVYIVHVREIVMIKYYIWALTCIVLGHIEIDHTKAMIIIYIRTISKYS